MMIEPENKLFIRHYSCQLSNQLNRTPQILMPLLGHVRVFMDNRSIKVHYGEALVIRQGVCHQFQACEDFRFLVVNVECLDFLPLKATENHFSLDNNVLSYLGFVEKQLTSSFFHAVIHAIGNVVVKAVANDDVKAVVKTVL